MCRLRLHSRQVMTSFRSDAMTFDEIKIRMERGKVRRKPDDKEHRLQSSCVQWFRLQFPEYAHSLFAVPNGGRRDKATGARLKAEGVVAGVADLILLRQSKGYGALLIEMKTKAGRQAATQKEWQRKVERDGYRYVVCRSLEEFMDAVRDYLV